MKTSKQASSPARLLPMKSFNRLNNKVLPRIAVICVFVSAVLGIALSAAEARPLIDTEAQYGQRGAKQSIMTLNSPTAGTPFVEVVYHDVGNMYLSVKNDGHIGPDMYQGNGLNGTDGWMEFPKNIENFYPTPRLIVGGVLGGDTLVTQVLDELSRFSNRSKEWWPAEFASQIANNENITIKSINDTGTIAREAFSEQDISFAYYDTLSDPVFTGFDDITNRGHIPLNLRVRQTSYAWSFEFAEDFILIDYQITNMGFTPIEDAYVGIKMRGGWDLEIVSGHLATAPAINLRPTACEYVDSVGLFWAADSDGNPGPEGYDVESATAVVAVKLLRVPEGATQTSYNWWDDGHGGVEDWGPRKAATSEKPLRDYGGFHGEPFGDANTYAMMSNGEFDYDQLLAGLDHRDSGWIANPSFAERLAAGPGWGNHNHNHSFITVGPVDIPAGTSIPLTISYVAGENFHRNPDKHFEGSNPEPYYNELFFDDLLLNSAWASWVYDNPGIDSDPTDDDDYRGEIRNCSFDSTVVFDTTLQIDSFVTPYDTTVLVDTSYASSGADSIYYTGDGIPDFRAAAPPPPPVVRFTPSEGEIIIEWNGLLSETTPDVFTQEIDFEGYRVYLGLVARRADMATQVSYDIEDYSQRYYNAGTRSWISIRKPFSLEEARNAYAQGNADWHPLLHDIDHPLLVGDSIFYFIRQDWNQDDLTLPDGIQRIYPDAPYPHTLVIDSAYEEELTPDGKFFKRFEYRYVLRNLLPSQPYYASVTAFDYGSQAASLPFLETNPVTNAIEMFAMDRVPADSPEGLDVVVYPNPYRADGAYREIGFEGRGQESRPENRTRAVNFANLPPICTIRIFTIDGDLVDVIEHDQLPDSPTAMHEAWNIITRNTQPAVSGIYYWVVETPSGETQIGKLVLIM
jgi:hypothetical protein